MVFGIILFVIMFVVVCYPDVQEEREYSSAEACAYAERLEGDIIAADANMKWLEKDGTIR